MSIQIYEFYVEFLRGCSSIRDIFFHQIVSKKNKFFVEKIPLWYILVYTMYYDMEVYANTMV